MYLGLTELGSAIVSFMLGGIAYYYGGVFAFVMLGLNILLMAAVGTLMYFLTANSSTFTWMWTLSYEFYGDYAGFLFSLIGGIIAVANKPLTPAPVDV